MIGWDPQALNDHKCMASLKYTSRTSHLDLSCLWLVQHNTKWLSEVLDPVLQKYSKHCIEDSFTFAEFMQNLNIENETSFMCSFDISSLFTNVPLSETIKICADALYRSELNSPPFPEEVFIELMETATRSVEFSFNNEMYQQKDGVAMGKPSGTCLGQYLCWLLQRAFVRLRPKARCLFSVCGRHI